MKPLSVLKSVMCGAAATVMVCCSSVKHVPEGEMLLDKVSIEVDGDRRVTSEELINFLRQQPNHKVLGLSLIHI